MLGFFCLRGARRTILDYDFAIDTGNSPPVCCRRPKYGPHEKPIIMNQIESLLQNKTTGLKNAKVHRVV